MSTHERKTAVELVAKAVREGARRAAACRCLNISLRTLQRWEMENGVNDKRDGPIKGPGNALSEQERALVVAVATNPEFQNLPPSQIIPMLADTGIYIASESTFYRILREEKMLAHRGKTAERTTRRIERHSATGPNQVWSWDITYCRSSIRGQFFYLYLIIDVWSRKIVGWAVHESEDSIHAASLIRESARRESIDEEQLILHSDNGGPMKGATMLTTLQNLGIIPSFSRPRVSNDNAFSESLFGTMKTQPKYPNKPFESIASVECWVKKFVQWYNEEHLHSGIKFVTPSDRHNGKDIMILKNRKQVYEAAKASTPRRWSRDTRNWKPIDTVVLNDRSLSEKEEEVFKRISA